MKSNTIINISIVCFVIIGLFVLGYFSKATSPASVQSTSGSNASSTALTASETLYDFGTISMKNGNVSKEFQIFNSTDTEILLSTILTSCMCTSAYITDSNGVEKGPFKMSGMGYVPPANEIIKAGESRIIRVVYDPNAHGPAGVGRIDRFIYLTDSLGGKLELEIKALVTP